MHRLLEWLFVRGWGKRVAPDYDAPSYNLLAPCFLSSKRPHFYGRREGRQTKCLRCGFERVK